MKYSIIQGLGLWRSQAVSQPGSLPDPTNGLPTASKVLHLNISKN